MRCTLRDARLGDARLGDTRLRERFEGVGIGAFEVEHDVRMGALSDHSGLDNCTPVRCTPTTFTGQRGLPASRSAGQQVYPPVRLPANEAFWESLKEHSTGGSGGEPPENG